MTIGYIRDSALWFYYEENLEALRRAGARLVELSLLKDTPWPALHGLYLGGGFPETLCHELSAQETIRHRIKELSLQGLPIYAECGGFMYLAQSLCWQGEKVPMAGVLPTEVTVYERPQGLGYVQAEVQRTTPFHEKGTVIQGHEFHYSSCYLPKGISPEFVFSLKKGVGMAAGKDGWLARNTFASYTHIHALACPWWAPNFIRVARKYKEHLLLKE